MAGSRRCSYRRSRGRTTNGHLYFIHKCVSLQYLRSCWFHWSSDTNPVKYGIWIELDHAEDDALAYLTHILPSLATCSVGLISIQVKKSWTASRRRWQTLDHVILTLSQSTGCGVLMGISPDVRAPSWKTLPYECQDDLCEQFLPACAAKGIVRLYCEHSDTCRFHDRRQ